jgi:putative nucleotidyltransferase with HDIG domain
MCHSRALYRIRQFWQTLFNKPSPDQLTKAKNVLSPSLFELFQNMQAAEQAHALEVYQRLCVKGYSDNNLLTAALLHDVGKTRYPLCLWERVLVVLVQHFAPDMAKRWGAGEPYGFKRALVVAAHHANWGAELTATYGAAPQVIELIQRHHDSGTIDTNDEFSQLLFALQTADDEE